MSYEVLPEMVEDGDEPSKLFASYTPNNGIRIGVINHGDTGDYQEFDLSREQAIKLGEALIRWAKDNHGFTNEEWNAPLNPPPFSG